MTASRHAPVGVQLFSVAKEAAADLDGTLRALGKIGYRTVELAGYINHTPAELRAVLDRAGLACTSAHVPAKQLRGGPGRTLEDDLHLLADEAHTLGFDTVILPIFVTPPHISLQVPAGMEAIPFVNSVVAGMTEDDWKWSADYMNKKGAALKALGLRLGFHNHSCEFAPAGKRTALEVLIEESDPALVTFELDCGWAAAAGVDPGDFIRRYHGRFSALHLKDVAATTKPNYLLHQDPAEIGQGIIDWPKLIAAAKAEGITRFFVEQEAPYAKPVLEILADNYAFLAPRL